MYSTALSFTLPALTNMQRQQLLEDHPLCSLYELFATLTDPGAKKDNATAYRICSPVAALLCNCNSTVAIAELCRDRTQRLALSHLAFHCSSCPTHPHHHCALHQQDHAGDRLSHYHSSSSSGLSSAFT